MLDDVAKAFDNGAPTDATLQCNLLVIELYLPESWCSDEPRRKAAGVPQEVRFATKPQLALRMLDRAFAAGIRPQWVLADEVYGSDSKFRRHLENLGQPFVVAVSSQQRLWVDQRSSQGAGLLQRRVDQIADELPAGAWHRLSVGDGAKGPREYDWAAGKLGGQHPKGLVRWMLARRSTQDPQERAYYLCLAPPAASGRTSPWRRGGAGRSSAALRRQSRRRGWTNTRCAAGMAGTGTSRSRCSRWRPARDGGTWHRQLGTFRGIGALRCRL